MMAEHLHIYKIDPKEQARVKQLEEETQRRKDKRKHITLLENLQKMTKERLKRKGLAGGTPKAAAPGGKESIKDGIASLMRAGAAGKPVLVPKKEEEVQGEPVVGESPVKKEEAVGNKNEPESGLSRLTMILRGEDPETLRKKKLMLQKVLKKLRQMITEAESNAAEKSLRGQSSSPSPSLKLIEKFEDLEPQPSISFSQILPLKTKKKVKVVKVAKDDLQFEARSSNVDAIPWWERIYSNRH